jgi:hypothetical protein
MLKRFVEAFKVLVSRETLEETPQPSKDPRQAFLSWLLQPEKLPAPAVSIPPRRTPLWRWLFVPDYLPAPHESATGTERKSLLAVLVSREELPRDSVPVREKPDRKENSHRRKKRRR